MPGYVLVIFLALLNLDVLVFLTRQGLSSQVFTAIIGVFTAPAIGFLITQFWWFYYNRKEEQRFKKSRDLRQPELKWIIEKLKLNDCTDEDYIRAVIAYNYLSHTMKEELKKESEERLYHYFARRWDLYHTLGATATSVFLTFVSLLRWFIFPISNVLFFGVHVVGVLFGVICIILCNKGLIRVRIQWESMAVFVLTQQKERVKDLSIPETWKKNN